MGISLVLKILTMAMFGAALLALRSVKSEAHEVEEPSLAKGSEELPEQEEDLPVGEEEIIPAEACGKE